MTIDRALVANVDLLSLDAGNTVIFLDHARLATLLRDSGFVASPEVLVRTEGEAKRLAETNGLVDVEWEFREKPGAGNWGKMVATIAVRAGFHRDDLPKFMAKAWKAHVEKNLWCIVPDGLGPALDAIRERGVKTVVISNSEGMLERLFKELGILSHFDAVIDSGIVGVEKPDPRMFRIALDRFKVTRERALHLGDVYATDILGAHAAQIRCALIDPFNHYAGRHADVPRVPGVVAVANAIFALR